MAWSAALQGPSFYIYDVRVQPGRISSSGVRPIRLHGRYDFRGGPQIDTSLLLAHGCGRMTEVLTRWSLGWQTDPVLPRHGGPVRLPAAPPRLGPPLGVADAAGAGPLPRLLVGEPALHQQLRQHRPAGKALRSCSASQTPEAQGTEAGGRWCRAYPPRSETAYVEIQRDGLRLRRPRCSDSQVKKSNGLPAFRRRVPRTPRHGPATKVYQ